MNSNKIKTSLRNLLIIILVMGVFFTGYFLGNINYDLNPTGKEINYKIESFKNDLPDNLSVECSFEPPLKEGSAVWIDITGLNTSAWYLCSKVSFDQWEKSIDGYSIDFTNRSSFSIPMNVEKTNVIFWENKTTTLRYLFEFWIYEEVTLVDLVQAIPRLANFDLLSMIIGVIIGGVINIGYFLLKSNVKEIVKKKIKDRE